MSARNDGGPAFPQTSLERSPFGIESAPPAEVHHRGLSLRDWFAGQALAKMLSGRSVWTCAHAEDIARNAYEIADAMLKAREPQP